METQQKFAYEGIEKKVLRDTYIEPGEGASIALKIAIQALSPKVIVNSTGTVTTAARNVAANFVHAGQNASAVASGLSRALNKSILVFAGDISTIANMQSIEATASRNDNILYICYTNMGSSLANSWNMPVQYIPKCMYAATASISHIEDYANKLKKAGSMTGFRFINVLSPSPSSGFEPSNTVLVARLGVESNIWPLYESEKKITLTTIPDNKEPVASFFAMQKNIKISPEQLQTLQEETDENWKTLKKK